MTMQQICSVKELKSKIDNGGAQVLDVREYSEYQAERLGNSILVSISQFDKFISRVDLKRDVFVLCDTGSRAKKAFSRLIDLGCEKAIMVDGGLKAWKKAGYSTERFDTKVWSMERQVRCTAGGMILLGILLAVTAHPFFLGIAVFVGAGLIFSAVTDTCGMAMILGRMPWNKEATCSGKK